jgi:anti-sigma factor RsiW
VNCDCHYLEDYLDGELAPGESARFAAHLDQCPTCREVVDEQQWIDGLLRAPASAQLETPSTALLESFRGAVARRLQFPRWAVGVAAAAAVLLVAVGWIVTLTRHADGVGAAAIPDVAAIERDDEVLRGATFVGGPDVIVVPVASPHPEVTIVRIFPTYRPDISDQAGASLSSGDDDLGWPKLFNGG